MLRRGELYEILKKIIFILEKFFFGKDIFLHKNNFLVYYLKNPSQKCQTTFVREKYKFHSKYIKAK